MQKIEIPRENANDDDVTITKIFIKNHQTVAKNDLLFEFETSKASIEVEASSNGIISLNIIEGETVKVGSIAAIIDNEIRTFKDKIINVPIDKETESRISAKALKLIDEHKLEINLFENFDFVTAKDVEDFLKNKVFVETKNLPSKFSEDDIVLYGAGLQCKVVLDLIKTENLKLNVLAIIDSNPKDTHVDGINVFHKDNLTKLLERGLQKVHVCVGNGKVKSQIALELKSMGLHLINLIAPSAIVSQSAKLGEGIFLGSNAYVGREVNIGDLCQINHFVSIAHHCSIAEGTFIADGCRLGGTVKISKNVSLGIGVIINRDIN